MLRVGVFGCGAIGTELCKAIDSGYIDVELYAIYDRHEQSVGLLQKKLKNARPVVLDVVEMTNHVDLVVECASQKAVYEVVPAALHAKCDVMMVSVGALADEELLKKIKDLAREYGRKVYLPSGAIAGLDALKSASAANIYSVTLTTRKHPRSLAGAPYIAENNIDLDNMPGEQIIFEGSAAEAVRAFPANVNVAASLSIAGIGVEDTKVRIIADPALSRNIHEITVKGDFGRFTAQIENVPSPSNPRTSYLAALSVISTLKKIADPIQIGT